MAQGLRDVNTFGTADKQVLLAGMAVVLAVLSAGIGVLAARRRRAWACWPSSPWRPSPAVAALTRTGSGAMDVLPAIVGAFAGMGVLTALLDRAAEPGTPAYQGL